MNNHKNPLIFIGAGGHAHVLAEIAALTTKNVIGYLSQEKIIEKITPLVDHEANHGCL